MPRELDYTVWFLNPGFTKQLPEWCKEVTAEVNNLLAELKDFNIIKKEVSELKAEVKELKDKAFVESLCQINAKLAFITNKLESADGDNKG